MEKKKKQEKQECALCGGKRGFVKDYLEFKAHPDCRVRVPIDYAMWTLKKLAELHKAR